MATVNALIPKATTYPAIPKTLNPTQSAYQQNLAGQVKAGGINQAQSDAEMRRYLGLGATPAATTPAALTPEQTAYKANLAGQVASKGINQAQMDAEMTRYLAAPATPATPAAPAAPAAPTPQQNLTANTTNSITSNLQRLLGQQPNTPIYGSDTSSLFPNQRAFEPKNYEGSPLYQFQRAQGLKALQGTLAARGLTGSGAKLEAQNRFMAQLGAEESQRASGVAQQEADRLERMQQNEALRRERGEGNQFDRIYQLLQLQSQQNPAEYAYRAAELQANMEIEKAKLMAEYQRDLIPPAASSGRGRSSGGRSGSGGPATPGLTDPGAYIPSAASGPDFSGIDRASQAAQAAANADRYNSFVNTLAGWLK